jgi:SPP1 gp7 family putative phage head morphogenesis protein
MTEFQSAFAFDRPFEEAVAWFREKEIMPRPEFDALAAELRTRAFTAAYVYAADELQTVYQAALTAIEEGTTLRDFVKATRDMLSRPWHRETVFRTNVLSTYGKGHWDQAQTTREQRPYARYSAVMDGRTRPRHAMLHGLVYPLDHPFWKLYWPPWDYNCRCGVFTFSEEEVRREGWAVRTDWQGLPPPSPKFQSPAAGEKFSPDYGKYAPEIGAGLETRVREIHD